MRTAPVRTARITIVLGAAIVLLAPAAQTSPLPPFVWSRSHNGAGNGSDVLMRSARDSCGNIYALGWETVAGKAVLLVKKYDSDGNIVWEDRPAPPDTAASDVAIDSSDNVFVGGRMIVGGQGENWVIYKYSAASTPYAWSASYNSPASSNDMLWTIATDNAGNVLAGGIETRSDLGEGFNCLLRKYNGTTGTLLWSRSTNNHGSGNDELYSATVDASGNIFTAGYWTDFAGGPGYWMIEKLDSSGTLVWSRTYAPPNPTTDSEALRIRIDSLGNLVAAGHHLPAAWPDYDWVIRKYDTNGNLLWHRDYAGASAKNDACRGLSIMPDGTIVVAGFETVTGQGRNWLVRAYDSSGNFQWDYTYSGPTTGDDECTDVIATQCNNVFLMGHESTSVQGSDWVVKKHGTMRMAGCVCVPISGSAMIDSSLAVVPFSTHVGSAVAVVLTVTNTGATVMANVLPFLEANTNTTAVSLGAPSPTGPVTLGPGSAQSFTWTCATSANGFVTFTGTATGVSVGFGTTLYASSSGTLYVVPAPIVTDPPCPAVLNSSVSISPESPELGSDITVVLTVTNSGTGCPTLTPQLELTAGQTLVTALGGPAPAGPVTLDGGESCSFTWILRAVATGQVSFDAVASGRCNLGLIRIQASGQLTIVESDLLGQEGVKLVGGIRGYINPRRGEMANILVRPAAPGDIRVRIYNRSGVLIRELVATSSGNRTTVLHWDATDESGDHVPPGVYPVLIEAPGIRYRDKLAVLR